MSLSLVACFTIATTIYVAPNGSNSNPGTREQPLASLQAARDKARSLPKGEIVIELADGIYSLQKPIELDDRDSGVVWRAANRGCAIVSGGLKPKSVGCVTDEDVLSLLPPEVREKCRQIDLPGVNTLPGFRGGGCGTPSKLIEIPLSVFESTKRLTLARWPNEGFARTGELVGSIDKRHDASFSTTGIFHFDNTRLSKWVLEPDLWSDGLWCYEWADAKSKVLKVDPADNTLAVDPRPIGFGIRENAQFAIINALSELDVPGEWVLDRAKRRIYVWPVKSAQDLQIAAARGLFRVTKARDVVFDGLGFTLSRLSAIVVSQSTNVTIRASTVAKTSSWAIEVLGGRNNKVVGCDLFDLGEGGVLLSGGDFATLTPSAHIADNNHIHHYGNVIPNYRPGVQLRGVGNRATHNLIHHSRHQAIAFDGNDHLISHNVIHDTCTFNDDAGSIYCCQRDWTKRGTVIERNLIHMTGKKPVATHTEAIYLDDFSSGVIVRENIINRATLGIYIGGGQDCLVDGNLILNCQNGICLGSRGIETFAKNISSLGRKSGMFKRLDRLKGLLESELWRQRYPNLLKVYEIEDGVFAHNALWNVVTNNVAAGCGDVSLSNWKKVAPYSVVTNNLDLANDPGFVDYANFNWNLREDSPARKLLRNFSIDDLGLYDSPERASKATRFSSDVSAPPTIRKRRAAAVVRFDLAYGGPLPDGISGIAEKMHFCSLPEWGRSKRIVTGFGLASFDRWVEYSFSFTPCFDMTLSLVTMGERGEDTLYDDIRVTGATIQDGGFETGKGWLLPRPNQKDYRAPLCNLDPPYGIIGEKEAKCAAAEGAKMACGNDMLNFTTPIRVRKGVPVTIAFKARALPTK